MARKTPSRLRTADSRERQLRPSRQRLATCPNGKLRYDERHNALLGLRSARRQAGRAVRAGYATARQECRIYHCGTCDGWHLTSMPLSTNTRRLASESTLPGALAA